jgi:predicted PurR-regulated permease PerM
VIEPHQPGANTAGPEASADPVLAVERSGEGPTTSKAMPPWLPRAIALFLAGLVLLWVLGWLFVQLRSLLIMLAVSLMISFALEPAVNRLERLGLRRGLGTLLVFVLTTIAAALFGWIIGRLVTDQSAQLIESGPGYIEQAQGWINRNFNTQIDTQKLLAEFQEGGRLSDAAAAIAPNIVAVGSAVVVVLFQALTVAMFSYYLVADGPRLRRAICSLLPPARQREVLRAWEVAIDKTGGFMYSRAVLALVSLIFHWVGFAAVGIPSPVALALWVAVISQFVPVIGTYLAGTLPVLVALAEDPPKALWVLGLVLVYQQLENYLLAPRVTAHTMQVHSAVAFGSVIAGAAILGPVGAVLALPVTATLTALASSYLERHEVVHDRLTRDQMVARRRWLSTRRARAGARSTVLADDTVAATGPDVSDASALPGGSP